MRVILGVGVLAVTLAPALCTAQEVEFNRDIRPIFSDKCYTCHGPDKANRKSKLRFDTEAGAKQDLGGHFAIVPGDPAKRELVKALGVHSTEAAAFAGRQGPQLATERDR